jgi:hypothetical protein
VACAPPVLGRTNRDYVVKAQPGICPLHVDEVQTINPRIALAEDLASWLDPHLLHQGQCEGLGLLCEAPAPPIPRQGHRGYPVVVITSPPQQRAHNQALLVEDIGIPPLQRLDSVVLANRLIELLRGSLGNRNNAEGSKLLSEVLELTIMAESHFTPCLTTYPCGEPHGSDAGVRV